MLTAYVATELQCFSMIIEFLLDLLKSFVNLNAFVSIVYTHILSFLFPLSTSPSYATSGLTLSCLRLFSFLFSNSRPVSARELGLSSPRSEVKWLARAEPTCKRVSVTTWLYSSIDCKPSSCNWQSTLRMWETFLGLWEPCVCWQGGRLDGSRDRWIRSGRTC